jgi:hypothetical protein
MHTLLPIVGVQMKYISLTILLASFSVHSAAITPVLGVSLDPSEKQFNFPCTAYSNIVSCYDDFFLIEDSECSKSINFRNNSSKGIDILCNVKNGNSVVIGSTVGDLVVDPTQDAFGYVSLKLNSAISIRSQSIDNNHVRYFLKFN